MDNFGVMLCYQESYFQIVTFSDPAWKIFLFLPQIPKIFETSLPRSLVEKYTAFQYKFQQIPKFDYLGTLWITG